MSEQTFENKSYSAHQEWLSSQYPEKQKLIDSIKFYIHKQDTVLYWRHVRSYDFLKPFFKQTNSWLTVGDCYGSDAEFISKHNQNVLPTDIDDTALKLAKEIGFIPEFSCQNAEKITFADNSYDYILCNETYHHFPRPYIAVYEMLRVAKKALIIKDSQDPISRMPWLLLATNILDRKDPLRSWKLWKNRFSFEPVGNFVYKTSRREFEKLAMAMNLPAIAFYGYNSPYKNWLIKEKAEPSNAGFKKYKRTLAFKNLLCRLHIFPYDFLTSVIFNEEPDEATVKAMQENGYTYIRLPKNPYIN